MKYLAMLGAMTCVYALARLINYCNLCLEVENQNPALLSFLSGLSIILYFLSAPVSFVLLFWIEHLFQQRLENKLHSETSSLNLLVSSQKRELTELRGRIARYDALIANDRKRCRREGYEEGYHAGYSAAQNDQPGLIECVAEQEVIP